eukprot:TRINITY_DN13153_c0_g1_i1.p1 TRINITY_DN13153_c0_g1~~TRINITY_DN13153_c0_g1_i1.p1  ORF type:complete len:301 (-),score=92.47 TRINITY_DN13153_c0_g1_i1:99-1001(-)
MSTTIDLFETPNHPTVRLALPKGRMQDNVFKVLAEAGMEVKSGAREYRPTIPLEGFEVKLLKPQNVVEMINSGSRDLGFAGADWVAEKGATNVVELLDLNFDPVRIVAAAPPNILEEGGGKLPKRHLRVATEYVELTKKWLQKEGVDATIIRTTGATEVFPPEDADFIVDNTATGSTLKANNLVIFDELMKSSTRLYAHKDSVSDEAKKKSLDKFALLVQSVLNGRKRVMLEFNVSKDNLDAVIAGIPAMRQPTMAALHGDGGFAIRAAIPKDQVLKVVPSIKEKGATDIVVSDIRQILS